MEPREERRLTTILSADIVGYSRLMGRDEAGTLAALKAHHRQLVAPKAAQYRGRTVKLMGDGALMEFASVVDAVRFAIEVQCAMRERNAGVPEDRRLLYRIGINIGDIIVEGEDIYGDGVNIAARLQGLAEPGGICLARNVYNQIKGKLNLEFELAGEQEVKNIAEPVTVYRVVMDDKATALVTPLVEMPMKIARVRRWHAAAALVIAALAVGGLVWWQPWGPEFEAASVERMALPLPDKASIAVLPFNNLSTDPEQGYFADGMTEDLITDISKLSGIFVIARNSSFTYKNKPTKVQQVAEELGVRYVLEGSVQRNGDQVRINAQLVDALNGRHLWAERYDGSVGDVFALQDKVIRQIVAALAVNLTSDESAQVSEAETDVPQAYDAFLQGWDYYRRQTPDDTAKAITSFKQAIELDPGYSRAYAGLAAANWRIVSVHWQLAVGVGWLRSYEGLNENLAKALEKPTPLAYSVSAEWLARQGRPEEALAHIDRALALAPNEADTHVSKARILNVTGRAEEAEKFFRLAMRLNPHYGPDYLVVLGQALLHQEHYAEAAEFVERAVNRQPDLGQNYLTLAVIYGYLGRTKDAQTAVKKYSEMEARSLTVQNVGLWWYGNIFQYDEAYRERLREGLRKAGVPEGAGTDIKYADFKRLIHDSAGEYYVDGATKIEAARAKALHTRDVVFIDVRNPKEFGLGHIPSARNLELTTALSKENLSRLVSKDDEVVFSCFGKYCPFSAYASAKAVLWGYTRVYYFAGGFPAWQDAGYPVETSSNTLRTN
jgi:TolB-like protein/class 3 adenylate cyclase/rhodanese-related sulfurtransferase/thioredoxin-like negative regulator of GroEL